MLRAIQEKEDAEAEAREKAEESGDDMDGDAAPAGAGQRKTFNEDDQTALYMRVHDNQRQGRRGLGKSDTLKIAGDCMSVGKFGTLTFISVVLGKGEAGAARVFQSPDVPAKTSPA